MTVEFRLLGEVEVRVKGRAVDIGHARQRVVLAVLLVEANRTVPVSVLLDRVWGDRLPQRARNALSGYVSRIRRLLSEAGEVSLVRLPEGYRLSVEATAIDLHLFTDLVSRARQAADHDDAMRLLEQALGLWRGEAFGGLENAWLAGLRVSLDGQRLDAELDRNDVALRLKPWGDKPAPV